MLEDSLLQSQLDEYHLLSLLKGGGMARIYLGFDERLKRYLAVKIMNQPLRTDPTYTRRFEQEARTIGQLEHPNIVRLYRYGNVNGLLYMAMQYIEGADLRTILDAYQRRNELLEPGDIIRIIRPICLALEYAHTRGIVHRDVKPSNILISKAGHVFLADFGISLFTEFETHGEVFGTPHYIAPEQAISSDQAVAQSDLYSLGVMLYEMFTGKLPFDAPEPLNIAYQHINQTPTPPRVIRPELAPAVEAVILKALAKAPTARYATGAELADALNTAVQPEGSAPALSALSPVLLERIAQLTSPLPAAVIAPAAYVSPAAPTQTLEQHTVPARPRGARQPRRFSNVYLGIGAAALLLLLAFLAGVVWLPGRSQAGGSAGKATLVAQNIDPATVTTTVPAKNPPTVVPAPTVTATVAHEASPLITSSPTVTPTLTRTAAVTVTANSTTALLMPLVASPPVTPTVQPTTSLAVPASPVATPTVSPTVVAAAENYTLLFTKNRDQSLFVANTTARDLPLDRLALRNNDGEIKGEEWGVALLAPKACVTAWQNEQKATQAEAPCRVVGKPLIRQGNERFWRNDFAVYYNGQWVGACAKDKTECLVTTAAKASENTDKPANAQQDNGKKKGKKKDHGKGND